MRLRTGFAAVLALGGSLSMTSCATQPPVAEREEKQLEKHSEVRVDPYYWMRDRESPRVLSHLNAENAYTSARLKPVEGLEADIFEEIKARIPKDDTHAPTPFHTLAIQIRYSKGQEYPEIWVGKLSQNRRSLDQPKLVVDLNLIAAKSSYFGFGGISLDPTETKLGVIFDTVGDRFYNLDIYDLRNLAQAPKRVLSEFSGEVAWDAKGDSLFYLHRDPTTHRHDALRLLNLANGSTQHLYKENNLEFDLGLTTLQGDRWVTLTSTPSESAEVRLLDRHHPSAAPLLLIERRPNTLAEIEWAGPENAHQFFVLSNREAKNFAVWRIDANQPDFKHWALVVPHRHDVLLEGLHVSRHALGLNIRKNGFSTVEVYKRAAQTGAIASSPLDLTFPDSVSMASVEMLHDWASPKVRIHYESMIQSNSVLEWDLEEKKFEELYRYPVGGSYQPENYVTERIWIRARDGTEVPVTAVRKKTTPMNATAPLLLRGYGSYGISEEARFRESLPSLLDRGWIFALAHIRGGSELGRDWYLNGKLNKKWNTFHDFIDCADQLIQKGLASKSRLYAYGGSAGGLLMGVILNERPELFAGVAALVPFVDVLTTMLDPNLPLTTFEYNEWGNPEDPAVYKLLRSYSPYDNIKNQQYPPLFVSAGYHDSQVPYWEPAKWVAKLRALPNPPAPLLLWTEMEAGHGGKSGRIEGYRDVAKIYAFLLGIETQKIR